MWRRLWGQTEQRSDENADAMSAAASSPPAASEPAALEAVAALYWLILWRGPSDQDRRQDLRALEGGLPLSEFERRFLESAEFRLLVTLVRSREDPNRPPAVVEPGLQSLGDDAAFVRQACRTLLGRDPDPRELASEVAALARGTSRRAMLERTLRSDAFLKRYSERCPGGGFIPRDVQLCELANPAKWDNPDWLALLAALGETPDKIAMHRKTYEFTQLLFGLSRLGSLGDEVDVLSVGAGHEPVLYWLANHARRVIATDMYGGIWQSEGAMEGDEVVFVDPAQYARFPFRREHLLFLRMDGRRLAFADGVFDAVYSLSSVEHFGGLEGARQAVAEMARVLKPGGILALSTEYCLSGPPHHEAFQPAEVHALLEHPALELVEPIDERVWERYQYEPVDLRVSIYQTPHMVVTDLGSVFTSVMAFLRRRP